MDSWKIIWTAKGKAMVEDDLGRDLGDLYGRFETRAEAEEAAREQLGMRGTPLHEGPFDPGDSVVVTESVQ